MNETERFLGEESSWKKAKIGLQESGGITEGTGIIVLGSGKATVTKSRLCTKGVSRKKRKIRLSEGKVKKLIKAFLENDFVAIKLADRPGVPDEHRVTIALTNSKGKSHELSAWWQDMGGSQQFINIYDKILSIEKKG